MKYTIELSDHCASHNKSMTPIDEETIRDIRNGLMQHTPRVYENDCTAYITPNGVIWIINDVSLVANINRYVFMLRLNNNKGENPFANFLDLDVLHRPEEYDVAGDSIYVDDGFRTYNGSFLYLIEYVNKFIAPNYRERE